jgi:hypothetical protein
MWFWENYFNTYNFWYRGPQISMEGGGRISIFALKVSMVPGPLCGGTHAC